jgi:L-asparaginase II
VKQTRQVIVTCLVISKKCMDFFESNRIRNRQNFNIKEQFMSKILLEYTRGGKTESVHRADVAVVNLHGKKVWEFGDSDRKMFWRSAAKPFQVIPFIEQGGMAHYGFTAEEVALMVSSHSGEKFHVDLLQQVLGKIGLTAEALACGSAKPMSSKAAKDLLLNRQPFAAVHNPCSGKHGGMLALANLLGFEIAGYTEATHPVQKLMHQAVADSAGLPVSEVETGIDGCGVPVFYLPLHNMAWAYARLAKPEDGKWGQREGYIRTIRDAMLAYPHIVAGTKRFDTVLMNVTQGRILAKVGAEAVYCMASVAEGIGITFKIEDGANRAITPAAMAILNKMGWLSKEESRQLAEQYPLALTNHRGDVIGSIVSCL